MEEAQDDVVAATKKLVFAFGKTQAREVLEAFGWTGGGTIPESEREGYVRFVDGWIASLQPKQCTTQPTTERTRPALTWADPAPDFDPWKGFFTEPADMADWQDTYYPR
jgi:hypothetical protein